MGVPPRWGFGPHSTIVTGGLHAQRSAGGDCSVSSDVLSPGFTRRGVGVWERTFAMACCRGDRLAHTTLILGGLPCFALPTRGVGAAHSTTPSSGPAYGVRKTAGLARTPERRRRSGDGPCTGSIFGSDAVQVTTRATHISVTVVNKMYGQKHPRRTVGRTARSTHRNQRPARVHMESDAPARVGKPARRRTEVSGMGRTRFLPPLKGWVSALWYL